MARSVRTQIGWSWGRGWGVYENVVCPQCGHVWIGVAAVGTRGQGCPVCDYYDEDVVWPGDDDELPNDGAWLDGTSMRWITAIVVDPDEDEDEGTDEDADDGLDLDLGAWFF